MVLKKHWRKWLSAMLSFVMVLTLLPVFSTTAYAANTSISTITAGGNFQTLHSGYTYTVPNTMSVSNLRVADNATVALYIPSGVVLTCTGSAGSGTTPGRAGIYLPSTSTLVVTGGGVLNARGGSSGSSSNGSSGTQPSFTGETDYFTGSIGGSGGSGGGGSGAGIGGDGGSGGSGGSGGNRSFSSIKWDSGNRDGNAGSNGSNGGSGSSMGTLYVLGTVSVSASSGSLNTSRGGGGSGGQNYAGYYTSYSQFNSASGGAGGGGGGAGGSAYSIGGGGGGGAGGGGGGSGTYHYKTGSSYCYIVRPGSGGGGGGVNGYGGYAGSLSSSCYYTWRSGYFSSNTRQYLGNTGGNATTAGGAGGVRGVYSNYWGGNGGSGGSAGSTGSSGSVYKASTASVSGASSYGTVSNHSAVNYTLYFDTQSGSGGTSSATAVYGTTVPNISVPARSQHSFMGYYTSPNGQGIRYYNQQGYGLVTWTETSTRTLYAYWVQNQFNVNLNTQGGSGGTTYFVTTGTDGTLLSNITIPTRDHYSFGGYYSGTNGTGTRYYNANGASVGKKITANTTIYAKWTQNQWYVTFNQNGGSGGASSVWSGTNGVLAPSVTVPTKSYQTFLGYYTSASGGTQYYNGSGTKSYSTAIASNLTLYAQWRQNTYNVSYYANGGSGTMTTKTTNQGVTTTVASNGFTRTNYIFNGWNTAANGSGTSYAAGANIPSQNNGVTVTLYAQWKQYPVSAVSISGTAQVGQTLTAAISPSAATVDYQWYRGSTLISGANGKTYVLTTEDGQQSITVKATGTGTYTGTLTSSAVEIGKAIYIITYNGLDGAVNGEGNPATRSYGTAVTLSQPARDGYSFMGWTAGSDTTQHRSYTIAADTASDVTVTAQWVKVSDTDVTIDSTVSGIVSNPDEIREKLNEVFETTVDDTTKGITTEEIGTAAAIKIVLEVKQDDNAANQELITGTAPGSSLAFYDITAKKQITDSDNNTTSTVLKEIPSHIDVVIPLTGDLANQSSYAVYRVHEGSVEMLTADASSSGEYYSVEEYNGTLSVVIRTRKFSTYGIVGSTTEVVPGTTDTEKGFDVQGRVIEREPGLVYKVDVSWGAMKFEFTTANQWDPDQHVYADGNANGWVQTGFDGTNNKISTMNHSNGDVIVNYAITDKTLTGVEMGLHSNNGAGYAEANNHVLVAAPEGSTDDELTTFDAYLWLNGTPDTAWITDHKTNYAKIAILLVTVAPQSKS